jgi:hypothetical protein
MSKLHNDLINEVDPHENVHDAIEAFCNGIADRIEASNGNRVRLTDLVSILREDPTALSDAIMNNTAEAHAAKMKTRDLATYDAPSPAFDKPRENVRPGMVDGPNEHRDQVFPENENTEAERERIEREQVARDRGQTVTVNEDLPQVSETQRKAEEDRRAREENRLPA